MSKPFQIPQTGPRRVLVPNLPVRYRHVAESTTIPGIRVYHDPRSTFIYLPKRLPSAMRRSSKESPKLSTDSQRLVSISQAITQAGSRLEERTWERNLDTQLQKLLKTNHQESIDAALNVLF